MEEKKLAVVALGGNAILRGNQKGTVEEQNQNVRETLENLIYLVKEGYNLIISHGNGPQVGNFLMSDDAGVKMYGLGNALRGYSFVFYTFRNCVLCLLCVVSCAGSHRKAGISPTHPLSGFRRESGLSNLCGTAAR